MIATTLKLNSASFDYYILRIKDNSSIDEIHAKLLTLRDFDSSGIHLVIDIDEITDVDVIAQKIIQLDSVANKFAISVDFILANSVITSGIIAGKPVICLPSTIKSEIIINKSIFVETPVRSGMVIKNDGDIIITNLISNNAEIISSGNVHVYGECRGRIIAGSQGDKTAKIFISKFNAEYISIAGIYRVFEDNLPVNLHNKAVQIFLDDKERVNIIPLLT